MLVRIGTRASPLALAQTEEVKARLLKAHPDFRAQDIEIVPIVTTGDRLVNQRLIGKELFTKELEEALFQNQIDLAVHSMKDVETVLPDGLEIACILPRGDARDVLVAPATWDKLPDGAVIGTSSLRRQALLLAKRPDLKVVSLRGNIGTRLQKLADGEVDGIILALAGLQRLRKDISYHVLQTDIMLPAPGQGALGVETRKDDKRLKALLMPLHCSKTGQCVTAERAVLKAFGGSCRVPVAAFATSEEETLTLKALIAATDGKRVFRDVQSGAVEDAEDIGRQVGENLKKQTPADILAEIL